MPAGDWEDTFSSWAQPPGATEQQRSENAVRAIRTAIDNSERLHTRRIKIFVQGSYRNRVTVRRDSDVDIGVMLYDYFLSEYPQGKTRADYGHSDAGYSFGTFKNELQTVLVSHFGSAGVTRGNKAFNIRENTYRVEADVVPLFEFREYSGLASYRAGVALLPDRGGRIENFPERLLTDWPATPLHYENGVSKNDSTQRRFKGVVRVLKRLRNEMADGGCAPALPIPGYLLECLTWNVPNDRFDSPTWHGRVQNVLFYLWENTKDDQKCHNWCEVDAVKYLFRHSQRWTRQQVHAFILETFSYLGII